MTIYRQERPQFCPHQDCIFKRRVLDGMCVGRLPAPVEHDGGFNHYRLCLNGASDSGGVFDLQVNNTDLEWFRWLFDALDGKKTARLSRRDQEGYTHRYCPDENGRCVMGNDIGCPGLEATPDDK